MTCRSTLPASRSEESAPFVLTHTDTRPSLRMRLASPHVRRLLRFAMVGCSGVVVDMTILFVLSDPSTLGFGLTRSKLAAAELAMVNNFLWNDNWTFRDLVGAQRGLAAKLRRFARFHLVCGVGLLWNVLLLNVMFNLLHMSRYVANAIAIGLVTAWNYWLNVKLCFSPRIARRPDRARQR